MQPVYRRTLGTHLREITVCVWTQSMFTFMNEFCTVYLHMSVFWLHPVFDLLINKLLKLSEIHCKQGPSCMHRDV